MGVWQSKPYKICWQECNVVGRQSTKYQIHPLALCCQLPIALITVDRSFSFWQTKLWFGNIKEATGSSTASCPFENYLTFCHVKVKLCHFNEITISLEVHSRTYTNFKNVIWSAIFPAPPIFCKDVIFPESRCWGKHSDANRGTYFISTIQFKGQP